MSVILWRSGAEFILVPRETLMTKIKKGFAGMPPEKVREIAANGGRASGGNFKNNPTRAIAAGRKGGRLSGGQFRIGCERTREAGRRGGQVAKNRAVSL